MTTLSTTPSARIGTVDSVLTPALDDIDWDFDGATTNKLTHGLHPYPAKFIPQIPSALIERLSRPGETVVDVFCGSGTTLVESLVLGRNAIGVDASPLACLISEAKTLVLPEQGYQELDEFVHDARSLGESLSRPAGELFHSQPFRSANDRPDGPFVESWFDDFVIEELSEIRALCRALAHPDAMKLALTAFSSIIVTVSRQDSDTRYVRRDKGQQPGETLVRFARALESSVRASMEFAAETQDNCQRRVLNASALDQPNIGSVDLVISSPPYPNAFSYHLYHQSRMVWLEMDQPSFKLQEIGSHRKYSSRSRGAATVDTFAAEMTTVFAWLHEHVRPGGYACFLVGDSKIRGEMIDNAAVLDDAARQAGFALAHRAERTLQRTKKAFNPSFGRARREHLLVFKR